MNLRSAHVQWIVKRNPVIIMSQLRNETWSLPIGLIWSVKAFHPPCFSIHGPASSEITENVESTTDWIISDCPTRAQSAAIADEIVKKLIILPQVTSLCLKRLRPMLSTITGDASETGTEILWKVLGWSLASSRDIRLIITRTCRRVALGRTSLIVTFWPWSPSRLSLSLMNWAHKDWICKNNYKSSYLTASTNSLIFLRREQTWDEVSSETPCHFFFKPFLSLCFQDFCSALFWLILTFIRILWELFKILASPSEPSFYSQ